MAWPPHIPPFTKTGESFKVELSTDVHNAVLRLKDLGSQMKDHSHHFTTRDLMNIDELVYYLKELDEKRMKAHEHLEAETIKNSVVRRRLEVLPTKTKIDVDEKVRSARDLNTEQIRALQAQATEIAEKMDKSIRMQEVLNMHNELLETEHKKLSETHSVLVKRLNHRIAEKSKVQIELNEVSQDFRDTLEKVNVAKGEIRLVEEEMEKVMKRFTGDMHSLNKLLEGVKAKQKQKREEHEELKKKLKDLTHDVVEDKLTVEGKVATFAHSEAVTKSQLNSEASMRVQLKQGDKEIERLKEKTVVLEHESKKTQKEYEAKNKEIAEKRSRLQDQINAITAEINRLTPCCRGLKRDLKNIHDDASMQDDVLRDIKEKVTETKNTLLKHAEEGAQLTKDYDELVKKLNDLKISHQETISVLSDEIVAQQKRLEQSARTKEVVQSGYDEVTTEVKTKTVKHKQALADMQTRLTDGKRLSADLSEQMVSLETATWKCCEEIAVCDEQLKQVQSKLTRRRKSLTAAVTALEENVADLRAEIADRNETLSRIKPQCMALDKEHYEKTETYDTEKRELIALKSNKSEMEDRIKEIQKTLEKMHIPREQLKMDTLRCRAYTRQKVIQRTVDVDNLEKQVTDANQKLWAIQKENKWIVENSQAHSEEIARLESLLNCSKDVETQLDIALKIYRDKLSYQRKRNEELEKASSTRDRLILKDISELRAASSNRHQIISTLHDQFEQELSGFTDYLEVTARGPPSIELVKSS